MAAPRLHLPPALGSAALLGGGLVALELAVFRLFVASVGTAGAVLAAGLGPAFSGLGAALLASRRKDEFARRRTTAYQASAAGFVWVLALVGLVGVAHKSTATVRLQAWHAYLVIGGAWLAFALGGAALGALWREAAGRRALGRLGAVEALGGVAVGLGTPLLFELGLPRSALVVALTFCLAGLALARRAGAHWGVLVTPPLAIVALFAGDLGAPWLRFRADGRSIESELWTDAGLLAVSKPVRGQQSFTLDGSPPVEVAAVGGRRPPARVQDLAYALDGPSDGSVVVIGSGGGREVEVALASGYARVHAVERSAAVMRQLLAGPSSYGADGVSLEIGAGVPRTVPADVRHVVVVEAVEPIGTVPRLVGWSDARFTTAAVRSYLDMASEDGVVVLTRPLGDLAGVVAVARAALGLEAGDEHEFERHTFACAAKGDAALLVSRAPLARQVVSKLRTYCKRNQLAFQTPAAAELAGAPAAPPTRPFLGAPPSAASLASGAMASLARPSDAPDEASKEKAPGRELGEGATGAAFGLGMLALLLVVVAPPPRDEAAAGRRIPRGARLTLPALGLALGLSEAGGLGSAVRLMGHEGFGWTFAVPLWFVGVSLGRLFAGRVERKAVAALSLSAVSAVAAGAAVWAGSGAGLDGWSLWSRAAACTVWLVAPAASVAAAGLLVVRSCPAAAAGSAWGLGAVGTVVGALGATLITRGLGEPAVWPAALAALGVALLAAIAGRPKLVVARG